MSAAVAATVLIISAFTVASFLTTRALATAERDALVIRLRGFQWWWEVNYFDARTGAILWAADTTAEVKTVNGTMTHGGSIAGGTGPVPYHGRLFVPSGYGFAFKMPGNALLAYSVE